MPKDLDPTEGMTPFELLLAGVGQGMNNTANGLRQAVGTMNHEDIRNARQMDAALLDRLPGRIGSVLGSSLSMAPVALMPGANTLVGAGLLGAGMGLLQPSETADEALGNAAAFGLLGPASIATGRALPGLLSTIPRQPRPQIAR